MMAGVIYCIRVLLIVHVANSVLAETWPKREEMEVKHNDDVPEEKVSGFR